MGQLIVLSTMKWYNEFLQANDEKRKMMIDEFEALRNNAEEKGFLQNSRELEVE